MCGSKVKITCPTCKKIVEKWLNHVNRANKIGAPVYCSKKCSGIARRNNKSVELKKAEKAEYDRLYREKNEAELKIKRHNWFMQDYAKNPEKYRKERQRRYADHLRYLSRPKYKKWKKEYDRKFRANEKYGEWGECMVLLLEIEDILISNSTRFERYIAKDSYNKSQKRKRQCKKMQTNLQR